MRRFTRARRCGASSRTSSAARSSTCRRTRRPSIRASAHSPSSRRCCGGGAGPRRRGGGAAAARRGGAARGAAGRRAGLVSARRVAAVRVVAVAVAVAGVWRQSRRDVELADLDGVFQFWGTPMSRLVFGAVGRRLGAVGRRRRAGRRLDGVSWRQCRCAAVRDCARPRRVAPAARASSRRASCSSCGCWRVSMVGDWDWASWGGVGVVDVPVRLRARATRCAGCGERMCADRAGACGAWAGKMMTVHVQTAAPSSVRARGRAG